MPTRSSRNTQDGSSPSPTEAGLTLSSGRRQELVAVASLLVGILVGLTLLPWDITGALGRTAGRFFWKYLGSGAVLIPLLGLSVSLTGFGRLPRLSLERVSVLFAGLTLLVPFSVALVAGVDAVRAFPPAYEDWSLGQQLVGILPALLAIGVTTVVGTAGAVILSVLALSVLTLYTLDWHPFRWLAAGADRAADGGAPPEPAKAPRSRPSKRTKAKSAPAEPETPAAMPFGAEAKDAPSTGDDRPDVTGDPEELPPLDLLAEHDRESQEEDEEEIERLGDVLIETLQTFRVEGSIAGRTTGPVVTQYEVAPAPGVKVGRIAALADDLALAMRAPSIRIVAPIPGKAAVGVEVPNPTARVVTLRELLETALWDRSRATLPIALGRNLEGQPIIADLEKMPHLLIAGATGSGKSVCINTIITSLVYRYTPRELRMLMIDPKMVELAMYDALPHLLRARLGSLNEGVVTNNERAALRLKWVMREMDQRYRLFHANGARNIHDFNRKVQEGRDLVAPKDRAPVRTDGQADLTEELQEPWAGGQLTHVVVIIDELADLMMTVQSEVEKPLAILAQKARATGIHLILATQRPSVNVITGLIKANFPSRIAFRVASKVDSRTILDQNGAETLLGNGDMLFLPPGKSEPIRVQGAFISTAETEEVTGWYGDRRGLWDDDVLQGGLGEPDIGAYVHALQVEDQGGPAGEPGERDPLFREAAEVCIGNQLGSTSLLQRKLRIGYGRAARIIDQLHEAGVLGPPDGSKPREVLIGMAQVDEYCGE